MLKKTLFFALGTMILCGENQTITLHSGCTYNIIRFVEPRVINSPFVAFEKTGNLKQRTGLILTQEIYSDIYEFLTI